MTIVSWSRMVHVALAGAATLAREGVEAEVVDLRSLVPLDREAVLRSVRKTGKLVVLHEACLTGGYGAEIAAFVADRGFDFLDAPIKRVAAPDTPVPFSPSMEAFFLPDEAKLLAAVREIL